MPFILKIPADDDTNIFSQPYFKYSLADGVNFTTGSGNKTNVTGISPAPSHGTGATDLNTHAFYKSGMPFMTNALSNNTSNPTILYKLPLYNSDYSQIKDYVIFTGAHNLTQGSLVFAMYLSSDGTYAGRYTTGAKMDYLSYRLGISAYSAYKVICNPFFTYRNDVLFIGMTLTRTYSNDTYYASITSGGAYDFFTFNASKLSQLDNIAIKEVEESEEFGQPSTEGGYGTDGNYGTFDDSSDKISIPTAPTLGVTSAGFINVYSPSANELSQFGSELFPDLSFTPVSAGGSPSSVTDALVAMAQVLVDFGNQIPALIDMYINANLIQYVIDCHLIPVKPTTTGTSPLKVGFKTFSQTPAKVTSDYIDFDCGTLNVGEYYANFIDYAPYTSAKLYLPFVGFMDIAPEYWQSGTLQVIYRFNVIDGSFVAYVKSTSSKSKLSDTVIAQFGGNACVHIPITGLNYASMVSGIVSAVSPLLPSSKANVGTVDKLVNSANTIASAKPTMQQSNGYNATTSFLTVRVPYLLIERSVSNFSRKYDEENGIPSNITLNFANLRGFTKATMLHLDGIAGATEDDLDEIAQLLSEGVIL